MYMYGKKCLWYVSVNALTTMEGEIIHFPVPESERIVTTADISEEERQVHKDFFENRTSKTPDRYLKIRNYILDAWWEKNFIPCPDVISKFLKTV